MGKNRLAAKCHLPGQTVSPSSCTGANGILGRIHGQYITAATRLLPPAATSIDDHMEIDVDAGSAGRVRFFVEKMKARHHRHSHYFWSVYRAEPVSAEDQL